MIQAPAWPRDGQTPRLKETTMPVVHVEMWPGRTHAQKQELAKAITQAMVDIVKTTPEATIVIFSDVPKDSWAQGGVLSSET
jgi:4-oxalocrotonate tautomerase